MTGYSWPYPNETELEETVTCDVLILGGGMAGCFAAIAAAKRGKNVILVEKGATERSGSAGSGVDHWESACTNPCSQVTPKEIAEAYIEEQDGYSNGIAHYIECRESYDRLLDLESFGAKIRDTDDQFKGAEFRDDVTKLMFAYDYKNRFTLRVWGTTFKPALYRELLRLGVRVYDRTEATALLTSEVDGVKRGAGAIGMNVHTGRFIIFRAKATVLAMSRPARIWLFNPDLPGLCEFRPFQSIGSGHAMGYRAGIEFTMMEKSVRGEFSAAGRSFPPYGTGNNHNTWYAATMVDARGVEIPYVDRDGRELKTVSERYQPAPGQKFFLKGGVIDQAKYPYRGPETLDFETLMKRGYRLPFYADLSRMPEMERKVIWGMMVGEEGKTRIPILQNYTERGFDPTKHILQSYGTGWQSATFLPQERQLFGAPGGIIHDWDLRTNIAGIYAAGDQLFASDCAGAAAATGYYAGRKAATSSDDIPLPHADADQIKAEKERLYSPLHVDDGIDWRELNMAISKAMQNYCGGIKCSDLLNEGLDLLHNYETEILPHISCSNPHELMRTHEVADILTVSQMILHACLFRESSSVPLCFQRSDYPELDPEKDRCLYTIRLENGIAVRGRVPLRYFGSVEQEYEKRNRDYIADEAGKCDSRAVPEKKTSVPQIRTMAKCSEKNFIAEKVTCSTRPLKFDEKVCIGCNRCVNICQTDIMIPNPQQGKPPIVLYPGECYACGSCVMVCPKKGAITFHHPLMNRARFIPAKQAAQQAKGDTTS